MCGERFEPKRRDARYHSPACRQWAYRRRKIPVVTITVSPGRASTIRDVEVVPARRERRESATPTVPFLA